LEAVDPLNRLLGRQVRLRVDAEVVRDLGLAASGLLVSRMGGPSVYPPQPEGVYAFTQRAAVWNVSKGGDRYRRGLYTFFMRSVPYPMLTTFDTPKFNTTCTARGRSNTPLQSLTLANDDAMLEFARMLASRVLQFAQKDDERIRSAYLLCFGREPEVRERDRLIRYLEQQRTQLDAEAARKILAAGSASSTASAASEASATSDVHQTLMDQTLMDHAAWVLTSRVLLNLDEFITRD
jgi:hypothetical protein